MRDYYVGGHGGAWFVVRTTSKRKARSQGIRVFGRGVTRSVRLANRRETEDYVAIMGQAALNDDNV
jgi:hypothetical protein